MSAPFVGIIVPLEGRPVIRWTARDEAAHARLVLDLARRERPGVIVEVGVALRDALLEELDRLREAS